jgi:hypothetical protein
MTAKSSTARSAAFRKRAKAAGLERVDLYVHPDDAPAIREFAAKLARNRERAELKARGV